MEDIPGIKWRLQSDHETLIPLLIVAVLIGVLTGFLAVGFRYLLLVASRLCWHDPLDIIGGATQLPWIAVILIPLSGGLLVGPIVSKLAPETRGAGVPEVIHAVASKQGIIRHRTTFYKILSTVVSIGSGASVGREGPIVHIGASVGSSVAQLVRLSSEWRSVFLACGAAAGIAATFNAPMAGMLFAVEIILVDFEISYLSHIAISAVAATVVSHQFLGNLPAFDIPPYTLVSYWEILLYGLLGIIAGFVSIAFIKSISIVEDTLNRFRIPSGLQPAVGGLIVGLLAVKVPHVLGVGYQSVNLILTGKMALDIIAVVLVCKLAATSFSIGGGFSGGIFAPSLVLGALLGGIFGVAVNHLFPEWSAAYPAYGLVGMGAIVSGVTMAPITAIFTIFELTYNFEIILPLITSCITSLIVVKKFYGNSIYETKLLKKGIKIVRGHDVNLLRSIHVTEYMDRAYERIGVGTGLLDLIAKARESTYPHFVVLNDGDELVGMLSMRDLKYCLSDMADLSTIVVAADIMTQNVHCLVPADTLETAFEAFEGKHISTLPVVDPVNRKKVLGILKKSNLILAYNEKVLKTHIFRNQRR
ncbi:chloride channel protein [Desulfosarcina ovata subsp. sediminis]|uniref:Chloride channel protein n=1 Tax=Desulfosarcina ovata subsp. sediminis TaxID=885957 RepID=A0A5K7ZXH9_9BACT|nr:chloride channel protein [Desulfosarcina ovata]BBO84975.1 chloride channel protein [Desulfosarcina ovata subsp. sediminis]